MTSQTRRKERVPLMVMVAVDLQPQDLVVSKDDEKNKRPLLGGQ